MGNFLGGVLMTSPTSFVHSLREALEDGAQVTDVLHGFNRFVTHASVAGAPSQCLWDVYDRITELRMPFQPGSTQFAHWDDLAERLGKIPEAMRHSAVTRTITEGGLVFFLPNAQGSVDATRSPEKGLLDYVVLPAQWKHIPEVQTIENSMWGTVPFPEWGTNGLAYTRYDQLHALYPEGTLVTPHNGTIIGYVGVEKIPSVRIGHNMPAYDHDPNIWHDPSGNTWYILNHSVLAIAQKLGLKGVSRAIITNLIDRAQTQNMDVAVIWNHDHPYLKPPDGAQKFWGGYGFRSLPDTVDENWGPVEGQKKTGGEIWRWSKEGR